MISSSFSPSYASSDNFLLCLSASIPNQLLFPQSSAWFASVLASSVRNPRFLALGTVRPLCIVKPTNASHAQAAVVCGRRHGVRLRVRSGGHDYEGLSYRSVRPGAAFTVVDLARLRSVRVTRGPPATAWGDSGATLGELSTTPPGGPAAVSRSRRACARRWALAGTSAEAASACSFASMASPPTTSCMPCW
ncbi:hypothetical protein QYE76_048436 [Lolium multiflorum]|uniref:FAD-binding PCMH-type domain-containing protein n=1 Tax=Lolium multiflorum TaxID=4521 RepID=A0AAD8WF28_LOLMU|nr:hypothetical protein QYE76_048436 [Lolium multiflorum]